MMMHFTIKFVINSGARKQINSDNLSSRKIFSCHRKFASGDFCRLIITFVKSLDIGQDRQNVMSVLIWIQTA